MPEARSRARQIVRFALAGAALLLVVLGGVFAWKWRDSVLLERIEVVGANYADTAGVVKLARVDSGAVLFDIEPELIEDRVRRHPWVKDADVARIPTGTLHIWVEEREPVLLVLGREGVPAYYLDESGRTLPLVEHAVFDVPLLTGLREAYRPGQVVSHTPVRALAGTLGRATPNLHALVSEVEVQPSGELRLYLTPVGSHGSIPVRLGRSDFDEKMERLHAFWTQAVLPQQDKTFAWIDLRFNSQIVTEEAVSDQQSAVSN